MRKRDGPEPHPCEMRNDVVLEGLTPGTNYSLRVQVLGSLNQRTDWSDAMQHMST